MTRYEHLQHMTSGEVWAVEMDSAERVIRSVGPLYYGDLTTSPEDAAPNMTDEDNDWFAEHDAEFRLLSRDEILQMADRANERTE